MRAPIVAPSTWRGRLFERVYFAAFRNWGSQYDLLAVAIGFALLIYPVSAYLQYQLSYQDFKSVRNCFYGLCGLGLFYVLYRFACSYRRTGMMLVGEGNNLWSIHMAGLMSFRPAKYASMDSRFMIRGTIEIVRASMAARPGDVIVIETHLLGDAATRLKQLDKLARVFPTISMWEGACKKPLNRFDAAQIDRHKKALEKRQGKEHGADIRAGDPRGMIVLVLPSQADSHTQVKPPGALAAA